VLVRRALLVSVVRPEQRPTVSAGQRSLTVIARRAYVSLRDTRSTPANGCGGSVGAGSGARVGDGLGGDGVGAGGTNSSAPMSVVPMARGSPSRSKAALSIGSLRPASIVGDPAAWR
jgi:hypothetical protein